MSKARAFGDAAGDIVRALIDGQADPVERAAWARIAHGHGHLTDTELAFYEGLRAA